MRGRGEYGPWLLKLETSIMNPSHAGIWRLLIKSVRAASERFGLELSVIFLRASFASRFISA